MSYEWTVRAGGMARATWLMTTLLLGACVPSSPTMTRTDTKPAAQAQAQLKPAAQTQDQLAQVGDLLDEYWGDNHKLERIRDLLDQVLERDPRSATAYQYYARYYLEKGYHDGHAAKARSDADRALTRAVELSPLDPESFVLRGNLYRLMDRPEGAKAALRKAEALGTTNPWLQVNWGRLSQNESNYFDALSRCGRVVDDKSAKRSVRFGAQDCLIEAFISLGRLAEADNQYQRMVGQAPDIAWAHGNYANYLLCLRGDYPAAEAQSRQALQLMDYPEARLVLAATLYARWAQQVAGSERSQAESVWRQAQEQWSGDPAIPALATCGESLEKSLLFALRDNGRGVIHSALTAIKAAADAAPNYSALGIFGMEVATTGRVGPQIFLDSEKDYRDQLNLGIRFTPAAVKKYRKQHGRDPDKDLMGKRITVIGWARREKIDFVAQGSPTGKYYYQTQIVVEDPAQVSIFDPELMQKPAKEPDAPVSTM
jgi:Tfp pilus assembly protein PilF